MELKEALKKAFEAGEIYNGNLEFGYYAEPFEKWYENLDKSLLPNSCEQLKDKKTPTFDVWLSTFEYERWFNDVRYLTDNGYYSSERMYDLYKKTFNINL